jgi:hypothetical protein
MKLLEYHVLPHPLQNEILAGVHWIIHQQSLLTSAYKTMLDVDRTMNKTLQQLNTTNTQIKLNEMAKGRCLNILKT